MSARRPHPRRRVLARLARVGLGALAVLAADCRKPDQASEATALAPVAPTASAPAAPVDHLAPGELLEGPRRAFGVALPLVMKVHQTFVDAVYASGPATVDALVPYFRSRLEGGTLRRSGPMATFDHAGVHGKPGIAVFVRVSTSPEGATVEVRDATPPVAPTLPDEAARWRQVGLTANGRLVDPSHLD